MGGGGVLVLRIQGSSSHDKGNGKKMTVGREWGVEVKRVWGEGGRI